MRLTAYVPSTILQSFSVSFFPSFCAVSPTIHSTRDPLWHAYPHLCLVIFHIYAASHTVWLKTQRTVTLALVKLFG
jgi:drug/metabolite transporter (DMT)-like permease